MQKSQVLWMRMPRVAHALTHACRVDNRVDAWRRKLERAGATPRWYLEGTLPIESNQNSPQPEPSQDVVVRTTLPERTSSRALAIAAASAPVTGSSSAGADQAAR